MNTRLGLLPAVEECTSTGAGIALSQLQGIRGWTEHVGTYVAAGWLAEQLPVRPVLGAGAKGPVLELLQENGDHELGPEGYRLTIAPSGIRLRAAGPAGFFYAAQTLLQIAGRADGELPGLEILDRPRFRWRGMHLDVSRHFFPVEVVLRFVDLLARHKLNVFHWHLTDDQGWRFEVPSLPRLTEVGAWRTNEDGTMHGGFYTQEEIRRVVDYAAERFVTVVPEVDVPGHALALLSGYPECSCTGGPFAVTPHWGIFDDVLCPGKERTFAVLEAVLDRLAALFPGPYIHLGGDECPTVRWESCPDCRRRMQAEGFRRPAELHGYLLRRVAAQLAAAGKQVVGWNEVFGRDCPKDLVVMSWQGIAPGIEAARAGHDVVMCPTSHCYFDYYQGPRESEPVAFPRDLPLEVVAAFDPLPSELDPAARAHVLGAQGCLWTERIPTPEHLDYMAFPRLCALAEAVWSTDRSGFRDRLARHLSRLDERNVRYRPLDPSA